MYSLFGFFGAAGFAADALAGAAVLVTSLAAGFFAGSAFTAGFFAAGFAGFLAVLLAMDATFLVVK
ncbi:MAG: hypothetical protein DI582_05020 [Azospirillum brasilense]|nr:MAG: hypothetical protein DI582_05020 [Azospirillum brasilense]